MATHIEHEMNSCLSEMERLQAKMLELQKVKEEKAVEEKKKIEEIEPNMEIMAEWLMKSKENEELVKKLHRVSGGKLHDAAVSRSGYGKDELECILKAYRNRQQSIVKKHIDVCNFGDRAPGQPFSLPLGCAQSGSQQEFMMNFVEATHNLFQIQQKRIDELENVVAELSSK